MVIDVTRNIDLNAIEEEVIDLVHEFEYSILVDRYNYLQENGVVMEAEQEKQGLAQKVKSMIDKFIGFVKRIWHWIKDKFKAIKSKLTGDKRKQIEKSEAETDKQAKETIDKLNAEAENPTEESGKKAQKEFTDFKNKQEKKAKDLEKNNEENFEVSDNFKKYIETNDAAAVKISLYTWLYIAGFHDQDAFNHVKKMLKYAADHNFNPYEPYNGKEDLENIPITKEMGERQLKEIGVNFSHERFNYVKKYLKSQGIY